MEGLRALTGDVVRETLFWDVVQQHMQGGHGGCGDAQELGEPTCDLVAELFTDRLLGRRQTANETTGRDPWALHVKHLLKTETPTASFQDFHP